MTMEDWAKRIDMILEATDNAILQDAGKITSEFAKTFAESEFEKYRYYYIHICQVNNAKYFAQIK